MTDFSIPSFRLEPSWLITASSYLIDRIKPDCARIELPGEEVPGGRLTYKRGPLPVQSPQRSGLLRVWKNGPSGTEPVPHANTFDLRHHSPSNWAHFLNNHLPIVFKICELMALDPVDTCLVLPQRTPSYITKAAELFGFKFHLTDASLIGDGIDFKAEPWIGVRADRQNWVKSLHVQDVLTALTPTANYGSRIFLSRRDTRCATNASELELYLSGKGFRTIFPEELSPADQIFIFREAEIIVAIHGAGLAPLLYAQPGGALTQLIEILHAGHMTDVYRVMAQQVGVSWIGVQGRLKPEYIRDAYAFENPFKTHSLDNFHVDLRALDIAFEHANVC